jgi:hypothetical protein
MNTRYKRMGIPFLMGAYIRSASARRNGCPELRICLCHLDGKGIDNGCSSMYFSVGGRPRIKSTVTKIIGKRYSRRSFGRAGRWAGWHIFLD